MMKSRISLFAVALTLTALMSCKSSQLKQATLPEAGMFKVAILYPNGEGKTFDLDYYQEKHMPMVAGYLGENLKFYEIDKGIAGRTPDEPVPFLAIGYFYVYDIAEYNKAIGQNIQTIVADFKNYTNVQPVVQVSEVRVVKFNKVK